MNRAPAPRRGVRLNATDTAATWTYGPGAPVVELAGTAEALHLLLWNRRPLSAPEITCTGDPDTARSALAGPLVP